jgi:PHP family Zn ribbon phosphoesterase
MKPFRADLHIHTLLSPCASLEMSPAAIIAVALEKGLDIIAVSDHNSTLHCGLTASLGAQQGIVVLNAVEVTTAEEVHCLVLLPDPLAATRFQEWLDNNSSNVPYNPELFGYQVVIDKEENILQEIDHFLPAALTASIDQVEAEAHRLGGLFIPAHIDRPSFSITSQLGFIPEELYIDAVEVTGKIQGLLYPSIRNSDAHVPEQIGRRYTTYLLDSPSFSEIALALKGESGRAIISVTP